MKVRQGWSGQVSKGPDAWAKFDIELEEEDLRRLFWDNEIYLPNDIGPPPALCFRLLEIEAERLIYLKLIGRYGYPAIEGTEKITSLNGEKAAVVAEIRKHVDPVPA